jgi:hypothetical protein
MTLVEGDEGLERELFALRAQAIEMPRLDLDDVLARVERGERAGRGARASRVTAWLGAAACAAASYLGVAVHEPSRSDEASFAQAPMSYFDGLSCRADVPDSVVPSEPGMCVAPTKLVCDVTLASSKP